MRLPGGIVRSGERLRDARFRPLTGEVEFSIADSGSGACTLPCQVTRAIAAALDTVGGEPVTAVLAAELCVADRHVLMYHLAARLGLDPSWHSASCRRCGERFDFSLRPAELPFKEAGPAYPHAEVEIGGVRVRLRVPNGGDQEAIAASPDAARALRSLLERCVVEAGSGLAPVAEWPEDAIARADAALEAVAPAAVTHVEASCPACREAQAVAVDPYFCLRLAPRHLLAEVHALAAAYRWSERDILALPAARRRSYVTLVDRARGMAQ